MPKSASDHPLANLMIIVSDPDDVPYTTSPGHRIHTIDHMGTMGSGTIARTNISGDMMDVFGMIGSKGEPIVI